MGAIGAVAGGAVAVAAIWGALAFAKSGHPVLAFLCGAGGVGAGANIAYASITGRSPWDGLAARLERPQAQTQNVTPQVGG